MLAENERNLVGRSVGRPERRLLVSSSISPRDRIYDFLPLSRLRVARSFYCSPYFHAEAASEAIAAAVRGPNVHRCMVEYVGGAGRTDGRTARLAGYSLRGDP